MIRIFFGEDRVKIQEEVKKLFGENYEVVDGENIMLQDLPSVFKGTSLFGDNNQICVVKSEKYGYMQLPGGGIEDGESIEEALRRETEEETGFLISDIKPIGYTIERREDVRNIYQWDKAISFVFEATPTKNIGTKYIDDEIAVGFFPMWINVDEFIEKQEQNSENTRTS